MNQRTKKIVLLGMLSALAFVLMLAIHIRVTAFLTYDPKDVVINIGGFLFGPLAAFVMSVVVSLAEMVYMSETGPVGLMMNVLSTCAFVCPAAFFYKRRRDLTGAAVGLGVGVVFMTLVMLLWNYLIVPIYLKVEREQVAGMIFTVFLPFNLVKGALNAAATMLVYKPVVLALRRARLLPPQQEGNAAHFNLGAIIVSAVVLATGILCVLVLRGDL